MECLAESEELTIFQNLSIRAIIEFKWPLLRRAIVSWLFVPYFLTLVTFTIYSLYVYEGYEAAVNTDTSKMTKEEKDDIEKQIQLFAVINDIFIVALCIEATYLVIHEGKQMISKIDTYF